MQGGVQRIVCYYKQNEKWEEKAKKEIECQDEMKVETR